MKILIRRDWRTIAATAAASLAVAVTAALAVAGPKPGTADTKAQFGSVAYSRSAAAQAAQGGCSEYPVSNTGFEIGVCINDRGTGTTAWPDIYVNKVGKYSGSCSIGIELWDNGNTHYGTDAQVGCGVAGKTTRYPGNPYGPVSKPLTLHAFARLKINGTSYYLGAGHGDSPSIALGPSSYSQPVYNWDIPLTVRLGSVGVKVKSTVPGVFKELHRCFNCSFPIPGAPAAYPAFGQVLPLFDIFGAVQAPVKAYPYDASGYLLYVAQPGHFDGAGSTVQFTFFNDAGGYTHLRVTAHAVGNGSLVTWFSQGGAAARWNQFARQLATNLVANGEGTILK